MTYLGLSHDTGLLLAAVAVSVTAFAVIAAIRGRMVGVHGGAWHVWTFLASVTAGAGVWGAHCLALLACDQRLGMGFDPMETLESLLIGVAGTHLAFSMWWSSQERLRRVTGGILFSFTVGGVHYAGMAALHMQAVIQWEPILVWVSTVSGAGLACVAALVTRGTVSVARRAAATGLMALATLTLLFVSLGAAVVTPDMAVVLPQGLLDRTAMLFVAALLSGLMITVGLGAAYLDDTASRRATARAQRLADATREGIALLGADRRIADCNAAFSGLCGLTADEIRDRDLWELVELAEPDGSRLGERQDGHVLAADGERVPVAVKLTFVAEQGDDSRPGLIAAVTDLREQRAAEARIRFLNEHDKATGLPNRAALMGRLEGARTRVLACGGETTLYLVDVRLTNSREINTLHGHAAVDALLAKVGERLKRLATSVEFTARLSDDAFAFYFTASAEQDHTGERARLFFVRMLKVLRRPFVWNAQTLEPQVRVGVARIPHDTETVAELMMQCESAIQSPDEESEDGVFFFRREQHEARQAQRSLAHDLRRAIEADELTVYYQPQARSEDGSLCGFEALVRWMHPERGFLPPDSFISVAESSGLIGALGEWVLRRACLDAMSWPKPVPVAVNLSPLQVGEPGLPARVHEILLETGLPPSRLELEVTESALFRDYQRALDTLRRLKALGIKIAMDDFGTGFSSLSTLQSFPFDKIKIDKSFVQGVGVLERSTVIVKAVLGIGRGLAIPVVAEGVETEEQMAFLRGEMCASIQGYYIGKPGPVELHAALFDTAPDARPRTRRAAA